MRTSVKEIFKVFLFRWVDAGIQVPKENSASGDITAFVSAD